MKTQFEHAYVLSVMSDDHPGIVAAVSDAISRRGGNIDACSQTVLGGYFTLIMIVSTPQPVEPDELSAQIGSAGAAARGLQVIVRPFVASRESARDAAQQFVITAFGSDKPGIIHVISQYLAGKDINIGDFYWERTDGEFVMVSQVAIPPARDIAMLQADLEQIGEREGFNIRLQHENIFVATNQLRLTASK